MDLIIAEEGTQHWGILEDSLRKLPIDTESQVRALQNNNLCHKICIRSSQVATSFSVVFIHNYLWEKKCYKKNLHPCHVVLTMKAQDR